jgi:hypothetical protein
MTEDAGQKRERKFWISLVLLGILAVLAWFTIGGGAVDAFGRPVQIRSVVCFVLGVFVLRVVMARWAEKIRQNQAEEQAKEVAKL